MSASIYGSIGFGVMAEPEITSRFFPVPPTVNDLVRATPRLKFQTPHQVAAIHAGLGDVVDLSQSVQTVYDDFILSLSSVQKSLRQVIGSHDEEFLTHLFGEVMDKLHSDLLALFILLGYSREEAERATRRVTFGIQSVLGGAQGFADSMKTISVDHAALIMSGGQAHEIHLSARSINIIIDQSNRQVMVDVSRTAIDVHISLNDEAQSDPLILDLDGNGVDVTSLEKGIYFDLNGDGVREMMASVAGNDAFLALDRNGNGTIDDGREFFGDQNGATNGFIELAKFDANSDRMIDHLDPVFGSLLLLRTAAPVTSLEEEGIVRLRLDAIVPLDISLDGGRLAASATFEREDGVDGEIAEVFLDIKT